MKIYKYIFIFLFCLVSFWANAQQIQQAEFYIDNDPGTGKATQIPFTVSDSIDLKNIALPLTGVSKGNHTLVLRVKSSEGFWSYRTATILVQQATNNTATDNKTKLKRAEYFFDTDPGYGKATSIPFTETDSIDLKNISVSTTGLSLGNHTLFMRVRDSLGYWTPNQSATILVMNMVSDSVKANPKIVKGEYFFGTLDPGYGKATPIANLPKADTTWDLSNVTLPIPKDIITGVNVVTIRFQQNDGLWTQSQSLEYNVCIDVPTNVTASADALCLGTSNPAKIVAGSASTKTYVWYDNSYKGTLLKTSSVGDSIYSPSPTKTTSYWVAQKSATCIGNRAKITLNVFDVLPTPTNANIYRCGNGKVEFTGAGAIAGGSYRWYATDTSKMYLAEGLIFLTDSITKTRNYYVSSISSGRECESPVKRPVLVVINTCNPQVITFPPIPDLIYGFDNFYKLKATSNQGLKVKYHIVSGPVVLHNDTIIPVGIGNVTIYAYQEGDSNTVAAAAAVMHTFRVLAGSTSLIVEIPNPLCTGKELKFTSTAIKDGKYEWSGPNGFTSQLQSPSIYNITMADTGWYRVNVVSPTDTLFSTIKVNIAKSPAMFNLFSQQQSLCTKSYALFAIGDSIVNYQWYYNAKKLVGETDSIISPSLSGVYSIIGLNEAGCGISSSPMYVNVDPDSLPTISKLRAPSRLKSSPSESYQWFINNYYIANSNKQELPIYVNGRYKIKTTDKNGCAHFSLDYTINDDNLSELKTDMIQDSAVSFVNLSESRAIVSPNPSTDIVSIHWRMPSRGMVAIQVYNAQGVLMKSMTAAKTAESFDYALTITDLPSGIYSLQLLIEDKLHHQSIVKK